MLDNDAPDGISPVNVACWISVFSVSTKSSAVSIWIVPALAGRDAVPIFPSGSPVEKKKLGVAVAFGLCASNAAGLSAKTARHIVAMVILRWCGRVNDGIIRLQRCMIVIIIRTSRETRMPIVSFRRKIDECL